LLASNPDTGDFSDGLDAFAFLGFSALGLRASRLVFFWPFAMSILLDLGGTGNFGGIGPVTARE
jgi:hypothetical protein